MLHGSEHTKELDWVQDPALELCLALLLGRRSGEVLHERVHCAHRGWSGSGLGRERDEDRRHRIS